MDGVQQAGGVLQDTLCKDGPRVPQAMGGQQVTPPYQGHAELALVGSEGLGRGAAGYMLAGSSGTPCAKALGPCRERQ